MTPPAPRRLRIAVDGPAASGKGTAARELARRLGYTYVDTGILYRTVGLATERLGVPLEEEAAVADVARCLDIELAWNGDRVVVRFQGEDVSHALRTEAMGQRASRVAAMASVRQALLQRQQELAAAGGVVMDGRDVGSVIMPDAELKCYLDASLEERALRRFREMEARGVVGSDLAGIQEEVARRDAQDRSRSAAPLVRTPDALYLDTTGMTPTEVVDRLEAEARARGA